MSNTHIIAQCLISEYERITRTKFDDSELKLQKLMYFVQKTSLAFTGEPLIDETFEGWKHGPVLTSLRYYFDDIKPVRDDIKLSEMDRFIIENTICRYGQYAPWKLRELSHEETAWKNARKDLGVDDSGSRTLSIEDIKKDAAKIRLYDHQYDMYIDEFEDVEEEFVSLG